MYSERASYLPELVAWQRTPRAGGPPVLILPDGCLDVIWHDGALFVAGPDTSAQVGAAGGDSRFAGLRFAAGTGPAVARHLQRRCQTAFGYGPKLLVRILRLQRAVALARAGNPFATVAATSGFADQAHLARDVRALAGVPLGELVRG